LHSIGGFASDRRLDHNRLPRRHHGPDRVGGGGTKPEHFFLQLRRLEPEIEGLLLGRRNEGEQRIAAILHMDVPIRRNPPLQLVLQEIARLRAGGDRARPPNGLREAEADRKSTSYPLTHRIAPEYFALLATQ
jgi:hypothetical protein